MANPVNQSPVLSRPSFGDSFGAVRAFLVDLVRSIFAEFANHANRLNVAIVSDGTTVMVAPVVLKGYLKTALPTAASWTGGLIAVTNETGGYTVAFSDGTNWRRVQDRAIVS